MQFSQSLLHNVQNKSFLLSYIRFFYKCTELEIMIIMMGLDQSCLATEEESKGAWFDP